MKGSRDLFFPDTLQFVINVCQCALMNSIYQRLQWIVFRSIRVSGAECLLQFKFYMQKEIKNYVFFCTGPSHRIQIKYSQACGL